MGAAQAAALAEHSRAGVLTPAEKALGRYSDIECRFEDIGAGTPFAIIAPDGPAGPRALLPTIFAISGEEQHHVSKFFRSWRAEARVPQWQVVIPLRGSTNAPYFYEPLGVETLARFMAVIVEDEDRLLLPYGVEDGRFHLIGMSNGSAAALAVAAFCPELVASLTMVSGFAPLSLESLRPLRNVPLIRIYVGEKDELNHYEAIATLKTRLDELAIDAELNIFPGIGHFNVGHHINIFEFWDGLERARGIDDII